MEVMVGPALAADVPEIAALERQCFSLPREEETIRRALRGFLVARARGELCGYADCSTVLDEGYIGNLAVASHCRRQGVGRALLRVQKEQGRREGLSFLTLEVRAGNAAAIALYQSEGFETVGCRRGYYHYPAEDAVLMTYFYKEG